ncbi:hypothetical protein [Acidovorax sp. LjRoot117]|uniref:hypothetical protein n=1 Tax=Acidovorax sp. LjRoot117 TaxID=3342255 RepID=UPI003F4F4A54
MFFSPHRLGSPPPYTPKGTWFSAMHLTVFRMVLRCIQNALKPALRAAESELLPTSTIQAFEESRLPFFQASIAHRKEVSAHRFSRPNTKEATKRVSKGAVA